MDFYSKTIKQFKPIDATENEDLLIVDTANGVRNITVEEFLAGVGGASVSDATTSQKGIVKQATRVETVTKANVDGSITGTTADTQLESMRLLVNDLKSKLNTLITNLKTAGIMEN